MSMKRCAYALLSLLISLCSMPGTSSAQIREIRISERVFLVRDRPGSPTEFQMIVNAGSADEAGGQSKGVAHYLEHLILTGRNAQNTDIAMRFFPDARSNGWTNHRATAYTHAIPAREHGAARDLEKLFEFYAARLRDFSITPDEAVRERNVVLQEFDWRYGSAPAMRFARKIDQALYAEQPFGQWPSGSRESIQAMTLADAGAFHKQWYHLNNVWFVIKGDIEPATLKEISDRSLASIPFVQLPPRLHQRQPQIMVERIALAERDTQIETTTVTYKKLIRFEEASVAEGRAAAAILSSLLSTQLSGSLHHAIAEDNKLVTGSPGISISRTGPGTYLASISAQPAATVSADELIAAISSYIDALASLEISDRNLARIKTRIDDARKSMDNDAGRVYRRLISWLAAQLDYDELASSSKLLQGMGKDQLLRLATAIAAPGRVVTGVLSPEGKTP